MTRIPPPPKVSVEVLAAARSAFIMGEETISGLSRRFGIRRGLLNTYCVREDWRQQREDWRNKQRQQLEVALGNEILTRHRDALREIHETRVLVARRVRHAIETGEIVPTIADLERLIRLERDLDNPGWSKPAAAAETQVNVAVTIDTVLEQVRKSRQVIEAEIVPPPTKALSQSASQIQDADTAFLLGDGEDAQ